MNRTDVENCPDVTILEDFLLGRLEPPTLSQCESHVAECQSCHETLRGLNSHDTLSEHVAGAFPGSESSFIETEDRAQVDGLVNRLLEQTGADARPRSHGPRLSATEAEVLADRAAEVLRCVTPAEDGQELLGSIGDYQLIRLLGSGSTGVVFQANDQNLNRTVALKVLRPSLGAVARERFIAEARLAASIEHPNVVTIYQVGQHERLAFIAMQWLPGETLEAKLNAVVTMDEAEVRYISAQVAAGLQAAHDRQLVHRDIKPANVWISAESGEVKILDFGLARVVDDDPGLTATGMLAGTPNFMSPEQTKGHELDGRSDLFSLGCMMYRMATGKLAFGATSILGTLQAIQHEQPTPPKRVNAEISDDLSDLTMSLLEKQPANRPESASQFMTMLKVDRDQWPVNVSRYDMSNTSTPREQVNLSSGNRVGGGTGGRYSLAGASGLYWRIAALIAAGLIGGAAFLFSPQIIRIATDQGELVIESEDNDVEVQVLQNGKVVRVLDTKTKNSFNIESGDYQIKAIGEGNSFEVNPDALTMKRGKQAVVTVTKQLSTIDPTTASGTGDRMQGLDEADLFEIEKMRRAGKIKIDDSGQLSVTCTEEEFRLVKRALALLLKNEDSPAFKKEMSDARRLKIFERAKQLLSPDSSEVVRSLVLRKALTAKEKATSKGPVSNQPIYKGQPFAHWINVAKTERNMEMLSDALQAAATLTVTAEEKTELLEVVRTLARKYGTKQMVVFEGRASYDRAMSKAIWLFDRSETAQFVLDELEHGNRKSIAFCSSLNLNGASLEQLSKLLKLIVARVEKEGGEGYRETYGVIEEVIRALIGSYGSSTSFEGGGERAYVAGVHEQRVALAIRNDPTLAPTIRQLFLNGSAATKLELIRLTRAFWPNDKEVEMAVQSTILNPSTDARVRHKMYLMIVGGSQLVRVKKGGIILRRHECKRETYWDYLTSSPKPVAVRFLKTLLENQLGPESVRAAVMNPRDYHAVMELGSRAPQELEKAVANRPDMIFCILSSAEALMKKYPNDTDEDVVHAIHELLQQIVAIEETDDPVLQRELDDFKALKVFEKAKQLLGESAGDSEAP